MALLAGGQTVPGSTASASRERSTVDAAFTRESYFPGALARLAVIDTARSLSVQVFRAGLEGTKITARDVMGGKPVTPVRSLGAVRGRRLVTLRIGNWPSGLYFARLEAPGGRMGHAPFVLRPRRLGQSPVAVILPTQTWQAYNFRDDDHDGRGDTWYVGGRTALLGRPFSTTGGVPPHYKFYDMPFLRWLARSGQAADYLSDADLHAADGDQLARAYRLLVFPGHHEYVTGREYDAVTRFRDLGGNLIFLSAGNFLWKIERRGRLMIRVAKWRDLGRPEASLIGVQYFQSDKGERRGAWVVRTPLPWLVADTGLAKGARFGTGGIEADRLHSSSPRGVKIIAEIPNLYGRWKTPQMTYYETRRGAKVFAAGASRWPDRSGDRMSFRSSRTCGRSSRPNSGAGRDVD